MPKSIHQNSFIQKHTNQAEKAISSKIQRKQWTSEEDIQLNKYLKMYGPKWLTIASFMENRNASQCSQRWKRIRKNHDIDANIRKQRWTEEEDNKLIQMYQIVGPRWRQIAKEIPNKTGKSVRSRYINFLNPNLSRSSLTEEEDLKIWKLYLKYGSQWSRIASLIPRRSENCIKNRFYSHIKVRYLNQPNLYYELNPCQKDQEFLTEKNLETSLENPDMEQENLFSNNQMNLEEQYYDESDCLNNEESFQYFPIHFR